MWVGVCVFSRGLSEYIDCQEDWFDSLISTPHCSQTISQQTRETRDRSLNLVQLDIWDYLSLVSSSGHYDHGLQNGLSHIRESFYVSLQVNLQLLVAVHCALLIYIYSWIDQQICKKRVLSRVNQAIAPLKVHHRKYLQNKSWSTVKKLSSKKRKAI